MIWVNSFCPFNMSFVLRKVKDMTTISKPHSLTSVRIKYCTLRVPNKTTTLFLLWSIIKAFFTSLFLFGLSFCVCVWLQVHCGSATAPGFWGPLHYRAPLVCVPDVIGWLAVWRHNKPNQKPNTYAPISDDIRSRLDVISRPSSTRFQLSGRFSSVAA